MYRPDRPLWSHPAAWARGLSLSILGLALLGCNGGDVSIRSVSWRTTTLPAARIHITHAHGVDYWNFWWDRPANLLYVSYSDYVEKDRGVYRLDLARNVWQNLPYEEAFSYDLWNHLLKLPRGSIEAGSPVYLSVHGQAVATLSHMRWGFSRERDGGHPWPYLDHEATFTGVAEVHLKQPKDRLFLAFQMIQVMPPDPARRISVSPDGRHLAYVSGCAGTVDEVYLFDLTGPPIQAAPASTR
jgi:hypothetical protein